MNKDRLTPLWIAGGAVLFVSSLLPLCGSIVDLVQSVINAKINRMSMELELDKAEHEAAAEKFNLALLSLKLLGSAYRPSLNMRRNMNEP